MAEVDKILAQISSLPAMPEVAMRLMGMLSDEAADVTDIHAVVRRDEAISAAVLRAANSARYGTPGRRHDLQHALTRLGMRRLVQIAIQETMSDAFQGYGAVYGMRRGMLWRASLGGAFAAEMIADETGDCEAQQAFLGGLLRDIGKIAVELHPSASSFLDAFERFEGVCFLEEEERCLGVHHAAIGAALAERWKMPSWIIEAITSHHNPPEPSSTDHNPLNDVVHAGDVVAMWAGLSNGSDGLFYPLVEHVQDRYLHDRSVVERVIAMTNAVVDEVVVEFSGSEVPGAQT